MKFIIFFCFYLSSCSSLQISNGGENYLLVVSKGDRSLNIINPENTKRIKDFPLGANPHEIEVTDEGIAFVSNTLNGLGDRIDVIDMNTLTKKDSIDTGPLKGPHGLSYVNDHLWFTAQGSKSIGSWSRKENRIVQVEGTGEERTHMIHTNQSGTKIYATNIGSGTISIFEYKFVPPHLSPIGKVPPGLKGRIQWLHSKVLTTKGIEGFHVDPAEKELWAIAPDDENIYILDLLEHRVKRKLNTKRLGGHRLKFSNDGKFVLVTNIREEVIQVFDAKRKKLLKEFKGCKGESILFPPNSYGNKNTVYISCTFESRVSVIDLEKFLEKESIKVGSKPDGLGWYSVKN